MKTFKGAMKRARASAVFTDAEVRAIRRADEAGLVSRLEQARTYGVGKETIARICRGETYFWVAQEDELVADGPMGAEPSAAEIAASQAKLMALLQEEGKGDAMVGELGKGETPLTDMEAARRKYLGE